MAIRPYTLNEKRLWEVQVSGTDALGNRLQRRRRGFETRRAAEKFEFELKRELRMIKDKAIPPRWGEWLPVCIERMKLVHRPSTVENYSRTLGKWVTPSWKDKDLTDISKADVYALVYESLNPELSPWSKKTILKFIKRILQMAVEEGILARNPSIGVKVTVPETDQKVLTNSEVEIFLKEAKAYNHRFYPIWVMALLTGMRSGEMYALKWSDVDLDVGIITVKRQWTSKNGFGPTKTQRSRAVPIAEDLSKFLKELKLKNDGSEFVLPQLPEWTQGAQAEVTREFCEAIQITSIKFHDLRATFITNLLTRGETLARVMSIVGHSQIKTTNVYLRKAGIDVQGATDKLGYGVPQDISGQVIPLKIKG